MKKRDFRGTEAKTIALRIAAVARAKKGLSLVALDMREVCSFCDYFVIVSATSLRQVNAIAKAIQEELSRPLAASGRQGRDFNSAPLEPLSEVSGDDESGWIALDYGSVVAHVFYKPIREFYSLERLWSDAKRLRVPRKL